MPNQACSLETDALQQNHVQENLTFAPSMVIISKLSILLLLLLLLFNNSNNTLYWHLPGTFRVMVMKHLVPDCSRWKMPVLLTQQQKRPRSATFLQDSSCPSPSLCKRASKRQKLIHYKAFPCHILNTNSIKWSIFSQKLCSSVNC